MAWATTRHTLVNRIYLLDPGFAGQCGTRLHKLTVMRGEQLMGISQPSSRNMAINFQHVHESEQLWVQGLLCLDPVAHDSELLLC